MKPSDLPPRAMIPPSEPSPRLELFLSFLPVGAAIMKALMDPPPDIIDVECEAEWKPVSK